MKELAELLENMFAHSEALRNSMALIITADIGEDGQERMILNIAEGGFNEEISEEHSNAVRVLITGLHSAVVSHTDSLQQWAIEELLKEDLEAEAGVDYGNA